MLERSVATLLEADWIERVIVVCSQDDRLAEHYFSGHSRVRVVKEGGATRRDSVLNGLRWLRATEFDSDGDWVMVHDAARPGLKIIDLEALRSAMRDADGLDGLLLALRVADTVKRSHAGSDRIDRTIDRADLWLAQTPQVARLARMIAALEQVPGATDEASALEATGGRVRLVEGSGGNFKVTTRDDLERMQKLLGEGSMNVRIGQGFDVHALVPGRALILGGERIDYPLGLLGHSDADVLAHAVTDALLGAAGLGDIGRHFPDSDPAFAGADSLILLGEAARRVRAAGFKIVNVDTTVVCQAPRLATYLPAISLRLAQALGIDARSVNVKAKTTERLGFEGRGEGISAQAIALIAAN